MSLERLQETIRRCRTPIALGLAPTLEQVPEKIRKNFEEMFGPGAMADAESLRYHGCQALERAQGKLPAAVMDAECYLRYGMMGADVLWNLVSAARAKEFYTIVDCRTTRPESWLTASGAPDGVTVMPYVGGDCTRRGDDQSVFALVRSRNESADDIQRLVAGDRPLFAAAADQMARRGAGLIVETGYSLDIREVRRRCEKAFMLLPWCDGENALPAFDDYGHGAMTVDYTLPYDGDVDGAVAAMKKWVSVV